MSGEGRGGAGRRGRGRSYPSRLKTRIQAGTLGPSTHTHLSVVSEVSSRAREKVSRADLGGRSERERAGLQGLTPRPRPRAITYSSSGAPYRSSTRWKKRQDRSRWPQQRSSLDSWGKVKGQPGPPPDPEGFSRT